MCVAEVECTTVVWRKGSRDSANRGVSTTSSKSQNSPKCEYIDRAYDKGVNEKTEAARSTYHDEGLCGASTTVYNLLEVSWMVVP